jgi:hypothetical protein
MADIVVCKMRSSVRARLAPPNSGSMFSMVSTEPHLVCTIFVQPSKLRNRSISPKGSKKDADGLHPPLAKNARIATTSHGVVAAAPSGFKALPAKITNSFAPAQRRAPGSRQKKKLESLKKRRGPVRARPYQRSRLRRRLQPIAPTKPPAACRSQPRTRAKPSSNFICSRGPRTLASLCSENSLLRTSSSSAPHGVMVRIRPAANMNA